MIYSNLIVPLVEAVKTLYGHLVKIEDGQILIDSKIEELDAANKRLTDQYLDLRKRLERIEAGLDRR